MPLRMLHLGKCRPGQLAGRAVVDDDGHVLVDQHACLTRDTLVKLATAGYTSVVVEVSDAYDAELERIDEAWLQHGLAKLAARGVPPNDRVPALRRQAATDLNAMYRAPAVVALFADRENVRALITRIVVSEFKAKVLAALVEIKIVDPALYAHALISATVSAMIARAVGLPDHRMRQLVAGTLLQDIGLIYLPGELDEQERLHYHPLLGYRILRECRYVEAVSAHVALEHHEFTDGSGEPRGVVGQNALNPSRWSLPPLPTLVGEIAAVANAYTVKTGRSKGGGLSPDGAIMALRKEAGTKLNRAVVSAFLKSAPIFPAGVRVVIRGGARDGFRGRVSTVNPNRLDRPVVTLERDKKNTEIEPMNVDLVTERGSRLEVRAW